MMQIAIKHWENPTSHLYLDFSVMTFGFASGNFIHLVAEEHPPLIRYYWTTNLPFLVTIQWGKEIEIYSSALSNRSGLTVLTLFTTS